MVLAGVLVLALITVESGGVFLVKVATGGVPANALQQKFFRAGHAHAAVLLVLSLVLLVLLDAAALPQAFDAVARFGVPAAALLMPAGFFLSVLGRDPQKPGRAIALLWVGAASLTLGLGAAGIGFISSGLGRM